MEFVNTVSENLKDREKIQTPYAHIIVTKICENLYFEIEYYDIRHHETMIGYGSYNLNNVLHWFETAFEVQNPIADVEPVISTTFLDVKEDDPLVEWGHCQVCGEYVQVLNYCPNCGAKR